MSRLLVCSLLLISVQASASVLYTWQMTKPSATIHRSWGSLLITDAAFRDGGASYSVRTSCNQDPCSFSDPSSPILRFEFGANERPYGLYIDPIAGHGLMETWADTTFDISFSITGRRITDLSLYLWNWDTNMRMENGNIITLSSDWPGCYMHCAGGSGFFKEVNIPEPNTLPLIGLALVGLILQLRRRHQ